MLLHIHYDQKKSLTEGEITLLGRYSVLGLSVYTCSVVAIACSHDSIRVSDCACDLI
jgi:hypothetical protein